MSESTPDSSAIMSSSASASTQANILVVDDSADDLELIGLLLRQQGHQARLISDGHDALESARLDPPDLILLDVGMPGMNGYELCERLQAEPGLREIPVLFLSAATQIADKVRAFQAGGVDYITKPFEIEELSARVRTQLELRRQRRELEESCERLRELERLRDNLAHMIIHDLRSPILGLQLSLEYLSKSLAGADTAVVELLARGKGWASRLSQMTAQLLDLSRLEAGQMPLVRRLEDVARPANAAIESVAAITPKQRVTLSGSVTAFYDADIVRRMVENLLINAMKFSPEGSEIKITITREGDMARVAVADQGPGIPPQHQQRIFEKFAQVDADSKRSGSGIGLAFCKLAAEAHGGQIGVISRPGQGSEFWFTLPTHA